MPNAEDPFSGTWKANHEKSEFDPDHHALEATIYLERDAQGYQLRAEGIKSDGQVVKEKPQTLHLDGKEYPVPGAPGVTVVSTRPDPNTIRVEARSDGRIAGQASYIVSTDGGTLTATVWGTDVQQRPFKTLAVFDRQ